MHSHGEDYDPWAEYRARRAEWRASRCARREAWREARRQRRAERRERWASWAGDYGFDTANPYFGMGRGMGQGVGAQSSEAENVKAKVASMQSSIDALLERVAVLEKLATDDDRKLAAEIERLRDRGSAT